MNINWDMGATMGVYPVAGQAFARDHHVTLRGCKRAVGKLPPGTVVDVFLDGNINGKSILTGAELEALQE